MSTKYNRGSEWRKWDLHIHSDASDGKLSCEEILKLAVQNNIECIALTDHHTFSNVDVIKSLAQSGNYNVSIIIGVEFRTEYGNKSVHMIGYFPDKFNGIELTSQYLHDNILSVLGISRSKIIEKARQIDVIKDKDDDYYFHKGWNLVQVDFKSAADLIHKYGGLVSVHAGDKSNSIDKEMKHEGTSPKNVSIYDSLGPVKDELLNNGYIDICEIKNQNDGRDFYWNKFHKPSITASDMHKETEFGRGCCWIKADCNFLGLRQILEEPDRISFSKPDLLQRIETNPLKFIKNILIEKDSSTTGIDEIWYDHVSIDVNPGLVAIIGNKGSGKSAITDIIGLCANSHNDNWSFLTKAKFRMPKPYNRSSYFKATLSWYNDSESTKKLDEDIDENMPERVKYIPQNFLENLCTTEDEKEFEKEMKSIIFQYLPDDQKFGKQSIDEIVEYLSVEINKRETEIKQKIIQQNEVIINLEEKKNPNYEAKLQNALDLKKDELLNLEKAKPIKVEKPDHSDNKEEKSKQDEITNIQNQIKDLEKQIGEAKVKLSDFSKKIQDLTTLKDALDRLKLSFDNSIKEYNDVFERNGLIVNDIIKIEYNQQIIDKEISSLRSEKDNIAGQLDPEFNEGLLAKKLALEKTLLEKEDKLSEPERLYQKYLQDLKNWEDKVNSIKGSDDASDTISYYEKELKYVREKLNTDIETEETKRNDFIRELLANKRKLLDTYTSLYKPISQFIDSYKADLKSYPMALDAAFIFDNNMDELFFSIVNQQVSGSFNGKEQGAIRLKELCESIELSDNKLILDFTHKLNQMLAEDHRDGFNNERRNVETQLKKGHTKLELYNFIYCLDYIKPLFQLKLSDKILSALSPGERGALLLLFYLFIDMDDKPLIIDQPEENLDNESVYDYLVTFIKKAKTKRQIIIVTHNPNLAVVCDADQIIKMDIDKKNKNTVSFVSGAIENPQINKCIINILEGTYPAFHNRDSKYFVTSK